MESERAVAKKTRDLSRDAVRAFVSPRWTLEYCIAMSCLNEPFHKAVHYGKKILYAKEYISLTEDKIAEANDNVEREIKEWKSLAPSRRAYEIFNLMLNNDGSSSLKAIVAQCLASILRWDTSIIKKDLTQEKMFDPDLYGMKIDETKRAELRRQIETDKYLSYIVKAIKYAAGERV